METSLAGPKRPQDRVPLAGVPEAFKASRELDVSTVKNRSGYEEFTLEGETHRLQQGLS